MGNGDIIRLPNIQKSDLLNILEFIYKRTIRIEALYLGKFLTLANELGIKGLRTLEYSKIKFEDDPDLGHGEGVAPERPEGNALDYVTASGDSQALQSQTPELDESGYDSFANGDFSLLDEIVETFIKPLEDERNDHQVDGKDIKVDEENIKVDEKDVKFDENDLKVDEKDIKVDEENIKVDENDLKVDEKDVKVDEKDVKINEKDMKVDEVKPDGLNDNGAKGELLHRIDDRTSLKELSEEKKLVSALVSFSPPKASESTTLSLKIELENGKRENSDGIKDEQTKTSSRVDNASMMLQSDEKILAFVKNELIFETKGQPGENCSRFEKTKSKLEDQNELRVKVNISSSKEYNLEKIEYSSPGHEMTEADPKKHEHTYKWNDCFSKINENDPKMNVKDGTNRKINKNNSNKKKANFKMNEKESKDILKSSKINSRMNKRQFKLIEKSIKTNEKKTNTQEMNFKLNKGDYSIIQNNSQNNKNSLCPQMNISKAGQTLKCDIELDEKKTTNGLKSKSFPGESIVATNSFPSNIKVQKNIPKSQKRKISERARTTKKMKVGLEEGIAAYEIESKIEQFTKVPQKNDAPISSYVKATVNAVKIQLDVDNTVKVNRKRGRPPLNKTRNGENAQGLPTTKPTGLRCKKITEFANDQKLQQTARVVLCRIDEFEKIQNFELKSNVDESEIKIEATEKPKIESSVNKPSRLFCHEVSPNLRAISIGEEPIRIDLTLDRQYLPRSNGQIRVMIPGGKILTLYKLLSDQMWLLQRIPMNSPYIRIPTRESGPGIILSNILLKNLVSMAIRDDKCVIAQNLYQTRSVPVVASPLLSTHVFVGIPMPYAEKITQVVNLETE